MKLIMESWKRFVNEEADPNKLDPNMFPLKLSDVEPKRANFLSRTGAKDEVTPDDQIKVEHKPEGIAPVQKLKPSQSSMNIDKALAMALNMMWDGHAINAGGDLGAFISEDGYIMDGHHRWIATAMIDPSLQVGGYLVHFPGEKLVPVLNAMTKGMFRVNQGKPGTGGFDQFVPEKIKETLLAYAKNGGAWGMKAEDVMEALEKFTGQQGEAAVEAAANKMAQNVQTLTMETPPWAPARPDMPVIDGGKRVKKAADALQKGQINVNPPYKPQRDPNL
jgi:hypothetical protein